MDNIPEQYALARAAHREINAAITPTLSRRAIDETASRLGLRSRGVLDLYEDEVPLLHDGAFYDYLAGGMNAVERFAARNAYPAGTVHARVLEAMTCAELTLLAVDEIIPAVGADVFDLLFQRDLLLADGLLSEYGGEGLTLATRVLDLGEFVMTTGAAIAFDSELAEFFDFLYADEPLTAGRSTATRAKHARELIHFARTDPEDVPALLTQLSTARVEVVAARRAPPLQGRR